MTKYGSADSDDQEWGDSVAWKRAESSSKIKKSGFASRIFTITVGVEKVVFAAHEAYLSQSPVFKKMCNGKFEESQTLQINLPDDDPTVIKVVLQYLYAGDFSDIDVTDPKNNAMEIVANTTGDAQWYEMIEVLPDIYITADKYAIQDLKTVVIDKITSCIDIGAQPYSFLIMAKKVYTAIPDSDTEFRSYFRGSAYDLLVLTEGRDKMRSDVRVCFDECIYGGGTMATDIADVLCVFYKKYSNSDENSSWETLVDLD
ncbi:MAG: hypothetical protein Q9174_005221 [Haloplaca sp. 1 TL-2023]